MIKQRKRKLGKWQVASLELIANKKVCCHLRIVDKVGGRAKTWARKYEKRLKAAVWAHNTCVALNSPIDPKYIIEFGPIGYFLIERKDSFLYNKYSPDNVNPNIKLGNKIQ